MRMENEKMVNEVGMDAIKHITNKSHKLANYSVDCERKKRNVYERPAKRGIIINYQGTYLLITQFHHLCVYILCMYIF